MKTQNPSTNEIISLLPNGEISCWYNISPLPAPKLEWELGIAFRETLEFFSRNSRDVILKVFPPDHMA